MVAVGVDLDPLRRSPGELVTSFWRDFGRAEAIAAESGDIRLNILQASWVDDRRTIDGVDCEFLREPARALPFLGERLRPLPRRLYARLEALDPEIVHFSGLVFPRELRGVRALLPDCLIVAQDHATPIPEGWRRAYCRWGLAILDAVMFSSRDQARPFQELGLLDRDLPVFEVMEVSTSFTPGDHLEARRSTGLTGDPCLFWLGHLNDNKDPLMVLDAVAAAASQLPGLRLHMCFGDAPLLARVRRRIEGDPALRTRVTLLGRLPHRDIEEYLRAADFLLQGSHRESGGYGVIEALACGTTPLVTDIPSFRRITGNGRFGALVSVGDHRGLAQEIVRWSALKGPALRDSARRHFEAALSLRAVGHELRRSYQLLSQMGRVGMRRGRFGR